MIIVKIQFETALTGIPGRASITEIEPVSERAVRWFNARGLRGF